MIPTPDQVVSAAGNLAQRVLCGSVADLRPMPRTLVEETELSGVHRYQPGAGARGHGAPVLLVAPLAVPARCYDLRRGCSLAEHLLAAGRPTYLVEYAEVSFDDHDLGIEQWVQEVVPAAVRAVCADAGGQRVHLVGWSLGGVFALLAAAADASLPVASMATLGVPYDVEQVPLEAPPRPLLDLVSGVQPLTRLYQAVGGVPVPMLPWVLEQPTFERLVTTPLALALHLDDGDFLAQVEAVERLAADTAAYRGRSFGQVYHRLLAGTPLGEGALEVGDRTVRVSDVTAPVLVVAGATDQIAPADSVKAAMPLLSGSREARFEIVSGGHLGMLTGRGARTGTWPVLDAWFDEWTEQEGPPAPTRRRSARKGAPPKPATARAAARKAASSTTGTGRTATRRRVPKADPAERAETDADGAAPAIGTNPARRYGSSGSRALRR
jgi:polyhydroxyalkanoate synthase